jgi:aspartate-semialdehyde dehydrogenase
MANKIHVGVLAATGSVGQRFVQLLDNHPWFEVTSLSGSDRGIGRPYGEVCKWLLSEPIPAWARDMKVVPTTPDDMKVPLVFSALPADIAREAEPLFARAGVGVCSNASAYRKEEDVPILLPEVNAEHAKIIPHQQKNRGWKGFITTNPNCTSTGLTVALKALQDSFGVKRLFAVSLQALSGAGYPGIPSMDIIDNVIPYIGGEEEKVEWETRKMLGSFENGAIRMADFKVSAHTNRVAVTDGHMVCLSVELGKPANQEEVAQALQNFKGPKEAWNLPSSPIPPIQLRTEADRPQPRLDRMAGKGMTTVAGRLRPDPLFDYKMVILSHNTIRGAAGGSLFNAELLCSMGFVK